MVRPMPPWFKSYLEGLNNELAQELNHWLQVSAENDVDIFDDIYKVIADEHDRRNNLGIL